MENIFIEFLPPWIETNLQPAFYDAESGTVLQQMALMYGKVNELTDVVNRYTEDFTTLYNYVHDYFDNLDVQAEVDHKLEEMAEDGTLTDIIAQYLQLAGVLAYSTVADMASATNLAVGSKAKTFGYKRLGDGVYNLYVIRESLNTDVEDGYNIVPITSTDNLVAVRQQYGDKLVINIEPTDNIQDYLNLVGEKTIILPANTTYTINSSVFINSDTTLDLNNSTLQVNTNNKPIIFMYGLDDTFTGYDGYKNITIRNGTITGACICMMHNKNVRIQNVEFFDPKTRHAIQIAGSYDINVSGCKFNGAVAYDETACELINIDPCNYGAQPYGDENNPTYDSTVNQYIVIENNIFNESDAEDEVNRYTNGVGSHGYDTTKTHVYCKHIIIRNNDFGSPYISCVNTSAWEDVTIESNTCNFKIPGATGATYAIKMRGGVDGMFIRNNNFKNSKYFIYSGEDKEFTKYNIQVTDNVVTTQDTTTYRAINWFNVKNSVISNNIMYYQQNAIYFSHLTDDGVTIADSGCENITISNNVFDKQDGTSNTAIRLVDANYITIADNNFPYSKVASGGGNVLAITAATVTNVTCTGNKTKFVKTFMASTGFINTLKLADNTTFFEEASGLSTTSSTGTFNIPLTYFKELYLQLGDATHSQTVVLRPWLSTSNPVKFDTTSRTYTLPVIKLDGTMGIMQFSITDSATKYSITSDTPLRSMYAKD